VKETQNRLVRLVFDAHRSQTGLPATRENGASNGAIGRELRDRAGWKTGAVVRSWKTAGLAASVLLAAVAIAYVASRGRDDDSPPRVARGQAHEVAVALGKLTSDPDSLVATPSRSFVRGRARRAVPPGASVAPHERSWRPDGHGGGVMTVTISTPGRPAADYAAVMVEERAGWKVLATVPVKDRPRGTGR
jgi:hypothetical protein